MALLMRDQENREEDHAAERAGRRLPDTPPTGGGPDDGLEMP